MDLYGNDSESDSVESFEKEDCAETTTIKKDSVKNRSKSPLSEDEVDNTKNQPLTKKISSNPVPNVENKKKIPILDDSQDKQKFCKDSIEEEVQKNKSSIDKKEDPLLKAVEKRGSPASGLKEIKSKEESKQKESLLDKKIISLCKFSQEESKHDEQISTAVVLRLEIPYFIFNQKGEIDRQCRACQQKAVRFTPTNIELIDKRCSAVKRGYLDVDKNGRISKESRAFNEFEMQMRTLKKQGIDLEKLKEMKLYPEKKEKEIVNVKETPPKNYKCQEIFIIQEKILKIYSKKEYKKHLDIRKVSHDESI